MKVQSFPVDQLVPYARNAKTHPKEQVDQIARQISSVGFLVPIIVDRDKVIVSGHGRLAAAKALGMTTVPVVVADHLTEDQAAAFRLADNKVAESPWDSQLVAFELQTLENHGFDLNLTAFPLEEVQTLLKELSGAEPPQESSPAAKEEKASDPVMVSCPECGHEFTLGACSPSAQ